MKEGEYMKFALLGISIVLFGIVMILTSSGGTTVGIGMWRMKKVVLERSKIDDFEDWYL